MPSAKRWPNWRPRECGSVWGVPQPPRSVPVERDDGSLAGAAVEIIDAAADESDLAQTIGGQPSPPHPVIATRPDGSNHPPRGVSSRGGAPWQRRGPTCLATRAPLAACAGATSAAASAARIRRGDLRPVPAHGRVPAHTKTGGSRKIRTLRLGATQEGFERFVDKNPAVPVCSLRTCSTLCEPSHRVRRRHLRRGRMCCVPCSVRELDHLGIPTLRRAPISGGRKGF